MFTLFEDTRRLATGTIAQIAPAAQAAQARGASLLVLDDETGAVVDLDLRGTPEDVAQRHSPKRGRPSLGVKAREVTLLPRHWEWLSGKRGGASAELRRLVEAAMRAETPEATDARAAQDAAYRAATTLAGDQPGYEEAMRALFAGDRAAFAAETALWPADIRLYVLGFLDRM